MVMLAGGCSVCSDSASHRDRRALPGTVRPGNVIGRTNGSTPTRLAAGRHHRRIVAKTLADAELPVGNNNLRCGDPNPGTHHKLADVAWCTFADRAAKIKCVLAEHAAPIVDPNRDPLRHSLCWTPISTNLGVVALGIDHRRVDPPRQGYLARELPAGGVVVLHLGGVNVVRRDLICHCFGGTGGGRRRNGGYET